MAALSADEIHEIIRTHAWREGEREAVLDGIAERKQHAALEGFPVCEAEQPAAAEQPAKQDKPKQDTTMPTQNDLWSAWVDKRVQARCRAHDKIFLEEVGEALRQKLDEFRKENAALRERLDKLEGIERSSIPPFLRTVGS